MTGAGEEVGNTHLTMGDSRVSSITSHMLSAIDHLDIINNSIEK